MSFATFDAGVSFANAAYDPETKRVFLIEANGEDPLVHVLKVGS